MAVSRAQRTRERILDASLALFNELGEPHVTTNDIAHDLEISPGNLHYHYRHKTDIVRELFGQFRARLADALALPVARLVHVEDVWLFLHVLFEQVRDYRFLFRDLDELVSRDPRLRKEVAAAVGMIADTARRLYRGLVSAGAMRAGTEEIDALAEGTAMTATYWLSYHGIRNTGGRLRGDVIGRGVYQAMAGLAPFLEGDQRALFARLSRDYL
jgi:AcrR family transcriptional regulator